MLLLISLPYAGTKNSNKVVRFIYTEKNQLLSIHHQAPPRLFKNHKLQRNLDLNAISTAIILKP